MTIGLCYTEHTIKDEQGLLRRNGKSSKAFTQTGLVISEETSAKTNQKGEGNMDNNVMVVTSTLFPNEIYVCNNQEVLGEVTVTDFSKNKEEKKPPKLKKDGTPKNIKCNKKKGQKSEVYAFQPEEMKGIVDYFIERKKWQCYLAFILTSNMARRIGDTLSLTWCQLINPQTNAIRADLEIVEKKTSKFATPHINAVCREAIEFYIAKTGLNPADNGYQNPVFIQTRGNFKGRVIKYDTYRKNLKDAAAAAGAKQNVAAHSTRKTFGMMSKRLHPGDSSSIETIQTLLNHSDIKTTNRYIGLTKDTADKYYDDFGNFFNEYVMGDKAYRKKSDSPMISLDTNDLRDIIALVYEAGRENAKRTEAAVHINVLNEIFTLIDQSAR